MDSRTAGPVQCRKADCIDGKGILKLTKLTQKRWSIWKP